LISRTLELTPILASGSRNSNLIDSNVCKKLMIQGLPCSKKICRQNIFVKLTALSAATRFLSKTGGIHACYAQKFTPTLIAMERESGFISQANGFAKNVQNHLAKKN
jgi:hypothetical protein